MKRREFVGWTVLGSGVALAATGCREAKEREAGASEARETPAGVMPMQAGSLDPRVEVDLERIGWNLERVREKAKVPVLAVVKANAYGHGLVEVGRYLESRKVHGLMVGKLAEAMKLREAGVRCPVFNYGPFGGEDAEAVLRGGITQSVFTDDARRIHEVSLKAGRRAPVNVHIDTGMNRAGVPVEKAPAFIERLSGLSGIMIVGVSTTFTEDSEYDKEQLRLFLQVCDGARAKGIELGLRHAASSAGLFSGPEFHLDMVRPGIALYGYYPNAATRRDDSLGLKPALRLVGRITSTHELRAGETVSYLRSFKATEPMRIATVGVGYSDGYPPVLGGKGVTLVRGKFFPVLPAVTSNHIMVDLKNDGSVEVGDETVLVDDRRARGVSADALAELGATSDYKILIGLNPEIPRKYARG